MVHIGFSLLFLIIIIIFKEINERSVIDAVLSVAGYTYGPLLGLFSFGLFTKVQVRDRFVPLVCIISPLLSYFISINVPSWFNGYQIGLEILIVNGLITFIGLWFLSFGLKKEKAAPKSETA